MRFDALDGAALLAWGGIVICVGQVGGGWWAAAAFCAPVLVFYLLREAALVLRGDR